ncbi:hypothetical protein Efla_006435 [Eimeria flavescens]
MDHVWQQTSVGDWQLRSSNRRVSVLAGRILSDDEKLLESTHATLSAIACSDTENESDVSKSREPQPPQSQPPPTASEGGTVQALVLEGTTRADHSAGGNASGTNTDDEQPSTSTGRGRKRLGGLKESELPLKKRKHHFRSADDQPRERRSQAELEAAQALLNIGQPWNAASKPPTPADSPPTQDSVPPPQASPQEPTSHSPPSGSRMLVIKPSVTTPLHGPLMQHQASPVLGLDEHSADGASPRGGSPPGPALRQTPGTPRSKEQAAVSTLADPAALPEPMGEGDIRSDDEQPSTSASAPLHVSGASPTQERSDAASQAEQPGTSSSVHMPVVPKPFEGHPFYRLPRVNPVDQAAEPQRFIPTQAISFSLAYRRFHPLMQDVRALFRKPVLDAKDLDLLAFTIKQLMSYASQYEGLKVSGRGGLPHTCHALGRRYLMMDAVVSGLSLLGVTPEGTWWQRFTGAVCHEIDSRPGARSTRRAAALFNRRLVDKLSAALLVLKSGVRLSPQETVQLKQMLLCSPYSPSAFLEPRWNTWRQDNMEYP